MAKVNINFARGKLAVTDLTGNNRSSFAAQCTVATYSVRVERLMKSTLAPLRVYTFILYINIYYKNRSTDALSGPRNIYKYIYLFIYRVIRISRKRISYLNVFSVISVTFCNA